MLYSTGAVRKERVSWVLRREVCTWFCFATSCTHTGNEGNTKSGRMDVIPRKHMSVNRKGCKQPHTGQLRQTAGGAVAADDSGIKCNLLYLTPDLLPSHSPRDTTLPPNTQLFQNTKLKSTSTGNVIEKKNFS